MGGFQVRITTGTGMLADTGEPMMMQVVILDQEDMKAIADGRPVAAPYPYDMPVSVMVMTEANAQEIASKNPDGPGGTVKVSATTTRTIPGISAN